MRILRRAPERRNPPPRRPGAHPVTTDTALDTARAFCSAALRVPEVAGAMVISEGADAPHVTARAGTLPWSQNAGQSLGRQAGTALAELAPYPSWNRLSHGDGTVVVTYPLRSAEERTWLLVAIASDTAPGVLSSAAEQVMHLAEAASVLAARAPVAWVASQAARVDQILDAHAFSAVFQPVIDLVERRAVGHEALTRFDDGAPPAQQFSNATRVGRGPELEVAAMTTAVAAARDLPAGGWLALNLSSSVLLATDALQPIVEAADRPVVFEITEHDPIQDYAAVRQALDRLPDTVSLSVDDAGSGFASLRHVLALEPRYIKLDRSWVTGIARHRSQQALVGSLAGFASRTEACLIAEGVEARDELQTLTELGVDMAQGFYTGRPEAVEVS